MVFDADPVRVEARGEAEEDLEREGLDHHDLLVEAAAEELDVLRVRRAVGLDGGVDELGVPLALDDPPVDGVPDEHLAVLGGAHHDVAVLPGGGLGHAPHRRRVRDEDVPRRRDPLPARSVVDVPYDDLLDSECCRNISHHEFHKFFHRLVDCSICS